VGGQDYFVYSSSWYKPFCSGRDVAYLVVAKPGGAKA
jgi:hypothetical protein